jgi:hypothetical protein
MKRVFQFFSEKSQSASQLPIVSATQVSKDGILQSIDLIISDKINLKMTTELETFFQAYSIEYKLNNEKTHKQLYFKFEPKIINELVVDLKNNPNVPYQSELLETLTIIQKDQDRVKAESVACGEGAADFIEYKIM